MPINTRDFLTAPKPQLLPNQRAIVDFVRAANIDKNKWLYIA